ncbi:helix-turn-helix transcriptional regulator [uncultured Microbacterium sp.]|uniref:helix-turn-helix domain-containing protein n=1 Tax=uncultured Microbacterium sp. TaxID=191216 RepID=UPI0034589793
MDKDGGIVLSVSRWLYELRRRRGVSQEQVAHAADVAVSTYSRFERCHLNGHPQNLSLRTSRGLSRR